MKESLEESRKRSQELRAILDLMSPRLLTKTEPKPEPVVVQIEAEVPIEIPAPAAPEEEPYKVEVAAEVIEEKEPTKVTKISKRKTKRFFQSYQSDKDGVFED